MNEARTIGGLGPTSTPDNFIVTFNDLLYNHMASYKNIYFRFLSLLPIRTIQSIISIPTLFPFHHIVSSEVVPHVKHLFAFKNVRQFKDDLDCLLKHFNPVSVNDLITEINSNQRFPKNSFLLTFDDGFRELYDVVAPILKSKGVPAIFFVNPAFIDNKELFYRCKVSLAIEALLNENNNKAVLGECARIMGDQIRSTESVINHLIRINNLNAPLVDEVAVVLNISFSDYLKANQPFLTTNQILELKEKGFSIGAHSWNHPYYHLISVEDQRNQTISSCNFVHDNYGAEVNLFSFPYNDEKITQTFFNSMNDKSPATDLFFGVQNQKYELNNRVVHRFNAENPKIPMDKLLNRIIGEILLQQVSRKNKMIRN